MKTKLLYLDNSYLKECDARVVEVNKNKVILDKTVFYARGGGQPTDKGIIKKGEEEFKVLEVRKENGEIVHVIDIEGLEEGDSVHCILDWSRRYKLMRMHTAAHVLASIFFKDYNAKITGNQIEEEKTRFDFSMDNFDREKMEKAIEKANSYLSQDTEVKVYYMPREEALKNPEMVKLASALPPSIDPLRIVEIPFIDIQADGGTHVRNLREVGKIKLLKLENKGKNNKRIYFVVE